MNGLKLEVARSSFTSELYTLKTTPIEALRLQKTTRASHVLFPPLDNFLDNTILENLPVGREKTEDIYCLKKAVSYIAQSWQTCSLRHHLGFSGKHPAISYN